MDKSLLDRLEKLEHRVDIGDPQNASLEALEGYMCELFGYRPSTKELERFVAEEQAAKEQKE